MEPTNVAVNPNTSRIYVTSQTSNTTSVIDGSTNNVEDEIDLSRPTNVAVNPVTKKIYVTNPDSSTIYVIDDTTETRNNTPVEILSAYQPSDVTVNPNTNKIYVTNPDSSTLSVIDGNTNKIETYKGVVNEPSDVTVNPNTNTQLIMMQTEFQSWMVQAMRS